METAREVDRERDSVLVGIAEMISVEELAVIVGRTVKLRRIGPQRWRGLCCFHQEQTPSFDIYEGKRGEGRYHCHGCGADGDGQDWQRKVLGQAGDTCCKPDPAFLIERERRGFAEGEWQQLLDRDPELPAEARQFIEPNLCESLRRRLGNS